MPLRLEDIKAPIAREMQDFEKKFRASMKTKVLLLDKIMGYIVKRKGKQMRPMFVFLSAGLCGEIREATYRGAALIELLHTAPLVHDDVVDEANYRRGFFSVYALWKNKIAVLVGDFLLSRGLLLSVENKDFDLLSIVSNAVREMSEGELSRLRASLVRKEALAKVGAALGLADHLRMGQGENASGGARRPSILADALEALIGAVFIDAVYESARRSVLALLGDAIGNLDGQAVPKDPKTRLQEMLQARRHGLPRYAVVATRGEAHQQVFEIECTVEGLDLRARGSGASRRAAEQVAAETLLRSLEP